MSEENRNPKGAGRKLGSKNKFPSHNKLHDEFLKHNFDVIAELVSLYKKANERNDLDCAAKVLLTSMEFLFPRRKPEDSSGDSNDAPLVGLSITNDQLDRLVEAAKGQK